MNQSSVGLLAYTILVPPDQVNLMNCGGLDSAALGTGSDDGQPAARRAAERVADDYQALLGRLFPSRGSQRRQEPVPLGRSVVRQVAEAANADKAGTAPSTWYS